MTGAGFPHSEILGSQLGWQLPQAYRGLPRPSSAPGAKASTIRPRQLDHNNHTHQHTQPGVSADARVHYAHLNQQPTPQPPTRTHHPHKKREAEGPRSWAGPTGNTPPTRVVPSGPNRVPTPPPAAPPRPSTPPPPPQREGKRVAVLDMWPLPATTHQCLRHRAPHHHTRAAGPHSGLRRMVLLRKEVIQPHLPVRLPCYDFVPFASPTFDRSLPEGLGHGLRVLPTFVT